MKILLGEKHNTRPVLAVIMLTFKGFFLVMIVAMTIMMIMNSSDDHDRQNDNINDNMDIKDENYSDLMTVIVTGNKCLHVSE
jgi:hypothetical protein